MTDRGLDQLFVLSETVLSAGPGDLERRVVAGLHWIAENGDPAARVPLRIRALRWLVRWRVWLRGSRLVRVTGWRSCLLDRGGLRERVVFLGAPWRRR